jgi:hypothetical protein
MLICRARRRGIRTPVHSRCPCRASPLDRPIVRCAFPLALALARRLPATRLLVAPLLFLRVSVAIALQPFFEPSSCCSPPLCVRAVACPVRSRSAVIFSPWPVLLCCVLELAFARHNAPVGQSAAMTRNREEGEREGKAQGRTAADGVRADDEGREGGAAGCGRLHAEVTSSPAEAGHSKARGHAMRDWGTLWHAVAHGASVRRLCCSAPLCAPPSRRVPSASLSFGVEWSSR